MKYKRNEKQKDTIKIDFELSASEWENEVEAAYQKNKGKYKKEGFRQGKVPRKVLESTYGEFLFYEDAFNDSFGKFYAEALEKEKDIVPVDYPDVKVEKMDKTGVKFSATVVVMPEIKLGKYKGLEVEKPAIAVTKAEIDKELESMRERNARFIEVKDRAIKNGDLINLDYSGSVDGKKFEGGTASDQELEIGSHTFIPGFEEQMVGMKIGEEKDIKVKFPETYHAKDLAGKESVFAVKVLNIRQKELPKLDDDFVKDSTEFNSLTELSLDIESKLAAEKEKSAEREVENKLVKMISDSTEIDIPEAMVNRQLEYIVHDLEHRLSHQGLTKDAYFGYIGKTEDEFKKERREDAKNQVKTSLVLEEIIKKEKIEVTDEDIDKKLEEMATMYNQKVADVKKYFAGEALSHLRQDVLSEKVIDFIKANNKVVSKTEAKKATTAKADSAKPAAKKATTTKTATKK